MFSFILNPFIWNRLKNSPNAHLKPPRDQLCLCDAVRRRLQGSLLSERAGVGWEETDHRSDARVSLKALSCVWHTLLHDNFFLLWVHSLCCYDDYNDYWNSLTLPVLHLKGNVCPMILMKKYLISNQQPHSKNANQIIPQQWTSDNTIISN